MILFFLSHLSVVVCARYIFPLRRRETKKGSKRERKRQSKTKPDCVFTLSGLIFSFSFPSRFEAFFVLLHMSKVTFSFWRFVAHFQVLFFSVLCPHTTDIQQISTNKSESAAPLVRFWSSGEGKLL